MTSNRFEPERRARFAPGRPGSITVTGRSRKAGEFAREAKSAVGQVQLSVSGDTAWLTATGQIDIACGDRFIACLREARDAEPQTLVIDLRDVSFIDSTGLSMLLKAEGLARQNQFELLIVRSPAAIVQAVLEATGVEKFLPLVDEAPAGP